MEDSWISKEDGTETMIAANSPADLVCFLASADLRKRIVDAFVPVSLSHICRSLSMNSSSLSSTTGTLCSRYEVVDEGSWMRVLAGTLSILVI